MSIATRLGKLEKEVNKTNDQQIYIIGWQGSFTGGVKDLTPEEIDEHKRTGRMFFFRDGVEELAQ